MRDKFVVHTPTKEEYDLLMEWAHEQGITWCSGDSAISKNNYSNYGKEMAITFGTRKGMSFANTAHFLYTPEFGPVIPFEQFAEEEGIYSSDDFF